MKSIFASKTFWLNIIGPVFTFLTSKGFDVDPDTQAAIVLVIMAVANVVMRRFTSVPVTILPKA